MKDRTDPGETNGAILDRLEQRLGRVHAQQRLGMEQDHEAIFGHGLNFFHPENWYSAHALLRAALRVSGLYGLGHRNTEKIAVRQNCVALAGLPPAFEGFSLLHVSDLHGDINPGPMRRLREMVMDLEYDICVLTGDFRGQTFGPFEQAMEELRTFRECLHGPLYAVLGNHDSVKMLPAIEDMGIRMLMNETEVLVRNGQSLYLSGVDDAHYYRADNLHQAASQIPAGSVSVLLSHTPEIYRQALHAGYSLMLSGHTHGGQICLPGSVPISLDAVLPRRMGAGSWMYSSLIGYTSVGVGTSIVPVRFNCFPEITIHRLTCAANVPGDPSKDARADAA